jgi:hypothetical protein
MLFKFSIFISQLVGIGLNSHVLQNVAKMHITEAVV